MEAQDEQLRSLRFALIMRARPAQDDFSSNRHPALLYCWSMIPAYAGTGLFPKTGIRPRFREGMLFVIML
jgi:hypothetical protein